MAAAAAANRVHWTVPQNLFRKPETHAHLEKKKNTLLVPFLYLHMYTNIFSTKGISVTCSSESHNQTHTVRVLPEHGRDHLPGEREDTNPDTRDGNSLQKLVELMVCEC